MVGEHGRSRLTLDERRGPLEVLASKGVLDCLGGQPLLGKPRRGPPVKRAGGGRRARLLEQACPEEVAEEVMVAVPAPLVVQADDEEVRSSQVLQHLSSARGGFSLARSELLGRDQRVCEVGAEAVEDRGPLKKALDLLGLAAQHLFEQVVQDEVAAAAECLDEGGLALVRPISEREGRELQPGDPALGTRLERPDVVGGEAECHSAVEECRRLVGREAQVVGADLGELTAGAPARERQGRVRPRGDDQVEVRRCVVDQEAHRTMDVGAVDGVVVVEDQHDRLGDRAELVQEGCEDCLDWRRVGQLKPVRDRHLDARGDGPQCGDDVGHEADGIAIRGVQRDPGDERPASAALGPGRGSALTPTEVQPFGEERRLSEAAGADTRVRRPDASWPSRASSRGRGTRFGRGDGT